MNSASFRKNRFFGPGRRVAAPEGPKIAGGAWSRLGGSRELRRASGTTQEPQGRPRSSPEMSSPEMSRLSLALGPPLV